MTPFVADPDFTLYAGDVSDVLGELPDKSVHCVVTSPPYWGLRDYRTGSWDGGDPDCDHLDRPRGGPRTGAENFRATETEERDRSQFDRVCGKCGATRTDQQLGLEPTPEAYVARMVEVFREVRRVLRRDGTCWLNIGDSYAAQGGGKAEGQYEEKRVPGATWQAPRSAPAGLKPKDLVGIPWKVAFALQADGWYLRSDIIWAKPNPMPESVTDRPTKSHEQVFLLTRSPRYYFDQEAIREPQRNARSVWTIATQAYAEAHFATFPEELPRRCIAAGTSERGCCPVCAAPWERRITATGPDGRTAEVIGGKAYDADGKPLMGDNMFDHGTRGSFNSGGATLTRETTGWRPTCDHGLQPTACVVLDPFAGSGTVALVARKLGRRSIGIELNPDYAKLAARRLSQLSLLAEEVS